ncbi:Retrovirus-related Pol polyprotein from transposon TNT 1-94 [Senna tora]|uniref:Retrovirus-related Pol polyprotein from transposon TNT 1-94 n=1 Tax=Senna tora TaxID=362788 RepID=A0A834XFE7_9FABA|nr:Retrovirus-related Pol polyprotein from transposon TNT 1-94 [Senna tora]
MQVHSSSSQDDSPTMITPYEQDSCPKKNDVQLLLEGMVSLEAFMKNQMTTMENRIVDFGKQCYPSVSKGYRFYYPTHGSKIVEAMSAKFLEDDIVDSDFSHGASITLENEQEITREMGNVIIPIPLGRERAETQVDEIIQDEQVHDNSVENPTGDET